MCSRLLLFIILLCILPLAACVEPAGTAAPAVQPVDEVVQSSPGLATPTPDPYEPQRISMVAVQIQGRDVDDEAVLEAMRAVPRHAFVPEDYLEQAYEDHPLPIGFGQTISQPYIVALMTAELQVQPGMRVLEIGTGSGYQAAVLAQMGVEVYTVEIIPELAQSAEARLTALGYTGVTVLNTDGYLGWEEYAPYDAVIVTCAPDHLPPALPEQLKEGGRILIPIGPVGAFQTLWRFTRNGGELQAENLGGVRFVPLVRP